LVISDPAAAKHVLRSTDNPNRPFYEKGLVAEVSKFLFGEGFAIADGMRHVQQALCFVTSTRTYVQCV
jgi:hypothetical protein